MHFRIHTRAEPSILEQRVVPNLKPNQVILPHEKPVMRSRSKIWNRRIEEFEKNLCLGEVDSERDRLARYLEDKDNLNKRRTDPCRRCCRLLNGNLVVGVRKGRQENNLLRGKRER
jgi:hypothetical protein